MSLSKNINPGLVLVQPFKTERLLMGHKESTQTNKQISNKHGLYSTFIKLKIPREGFKRERILNQCMHIS